MREKLVFRCAEAHFLAETDERSDTMRTMAMLAAVLAAPFIISCAAPSTTGSMPPPKEEEPWAEEIRQAKKAANKEAEYFVIRIKEQGVRGLDERTPITGYELQWRQKKRSWLAKARKKGFNGSDEEVEPKWVEKWKQPGPRQRRSNSE